MVPTSLTLHSRERTRSLMEYGILRGELCRRGHTNSRREVTFVSSYSLNLASQLPDSDARWRQCPLLATARFNGSAFACAQGFVVSVNKSASSPACDSREYCATVARAAIGAEPRCNIARKAGSC